MISTSLLTALKVAVPVGTVASMGGVIYLASDYLPQRSSNSNYIYLLVMGKTTSQDSSKVLTTTTNDKVTKNYFCQATLEDGKKVEDKTCGLYKLNTLTTGSTPQDSIEINKKSLEDSQLYSEAGSITASSHHILKVSEAFYSDFQKITTTHKQQIQLTNKADTTKHLGVVREVSQIDLANKTTNLFLAKISAKGSSGSTTFTQPLTCKLSATASVDCKIFATATTDKAKTNNLTKTELSNLKEIKSNPDTDLTVGNYVVVELNGSSLELSELQKQTLTINKKTADNAVSTDTDKVADVIFDQVLFGKILSTTPASSTVYPATPKKTSYVVKKGTDTDSALTTITTSTKNYKCKFGTDSKENFDDSCELKVFPTISGKKLHSYSSIQNPTAPLTGVESGTFNNEHFVLMVDSNKLFNLRPDWTKEDPSNVVVLVEVNGSTSKTASFTLLQELTNTAATGRTNMALVKYKTKTAAASIPETNKCFFTLEDKTGFDCSFKKVTSASPATPYDNLEFASTATTSFAADDHFALVTTTSREVKDFGASTISFNHTASGTKTTYTFDIIAPMGGDITSGKTAYFLGTPITTTVPSQK